MVWGCPRGPGPRGTEGAYGCGTGHTTPLTCGFGPARPRMSRFARCPERPGLPCAMTLVLAHRGANRVEPENTVAAFTRALELGADGVELDVHRTADGGIVVHHDASASGVGLLAAMPFAAIRRAAPR